MSIQFKSGTVGFALGIAVAAMAAQAAQPSQHEHPATPSTQPAPAGKMDQKQMMMSDPAKHHPMMEQMAQCRDMMSMMVEHMSHEGAKKDHAAPPK